MSRQSDDLADYVRKLESENASLRCLVDFHEADNLRLRELVRNMWSHGMCECKSKDVCEKYPCAFKRISEDLGIEVDG